MPSASGRGVLRVYRLGAELARKKADFDECWLKMKNDEQYVSFYYSEDGIRYRKLNYVINAASQNTHAYNGFLSLRPGIFAVGGGEAEFRDFRYTGVK